MRIAYFVWEYPPRMVGGLGTYASEIVRKFDEMGHEVNVFTLNDGNQFKASEKMGTHVHVHRPLIADSSSIFPAFAGDELKGWGDGLKFFSNILTYNVLSANKYVNEVAEKWHADIAICHDWLSAIGGATVRNSTDIPLVFHVHSTEHGRSGGKGSSTVRTLEYMTAQQADLVITVSHAMHGELNYLNFPAQKTRVVWNGVDEKKYDPHTFPEAATAGYREGLGVPRGAKLIAFTGRLTWVKGIDTLVRAMPAIVAKVPGTKLAVLGTGEMYEQLAEEARRLGLQDNIIFLNRWVEEAERMLLYASADLVCAPSRYEPFGIVALEGMSMEKPVLVGNGGLREAVIEGETGVYCDPNSPANLAEQALKVLTDDSFARRLGENGRKRVLDNFTWDKVARDTISLYEEIAKK